MPSCRIPKVRLVAEAELPILPFLAPRVFQPWPFARQKPSRRHLAVSARRPSPAAAPSQSDTEHQLYEAPIHDAQESRSKHRRGSRAGSNPSLPRTKRELYSQRDSHVSRSSSSRSRLAQDWYEHAFTDLNTSLVDHHGEDYQKRQDSKAARQGKDRESSVSREQDGPSTSTRTDFGFLAPKESDQPINRQPQSSPHDAETKRSRNDRRAEVMARMRRYALTNALSSKNPIPPKYVQVGRPVRLRKESGSQDHAYEFGYRIHEPFLKWNLEFARLNNSALGKSTFRHPSSSASRAKDAEYVRCILEWEPDGPDVEQIEVRFGLSWYNVCLHALFYLMRNSPHLVPAFLLRTHRQPHLPAAWLNDCFQFMATHYATSKHAPSQSAVDELVQVMCAVMDRPGPQPMILNGSVIRLLLPYCSSEQILSIFQTIVRHRVQVHYNTLLHLASYLARQDSLEQALDALLLAANAGADLNSPAFESTCTTILRRASVQPDGLRLSLRIIQNLADLGVKLNVQHCNVVMLNAVESGDLKSAFNVFHSLVDSGLQGDKYTHAILLKGCKQSIQDSETLNAIIRQAIADINIMENPVVAIEVLHCLYLHHFDRSPDTAFATVAEAFTQLFDPTPLSRIRILPSSDRNPPSTGLLQPPVQALGIMISAYLRDHSAHRLGAAATLYKQHALYKHIRYLAERGVEPWVQFTQADFLSNAFLVAFTAHPSGLSYAAEVVQDMQTSLPSLRDNNDSHDTSNSDSTERLTKRQPPTIQSWSILLHGFAKHKKIDLAEQTLNMMRAEGMSPNQVTWNSLVGGYVGIRDHDGALDAFKRMRDEGFRGSDVTWTALRKVDVDAGLLLEDDLVADYQRQLQQQQQQQQQQQRFHERKHLSATKTDLLLDSASDRTSATANEDTGPKSHHIASSPSSSSSSTTNLPEKDDLNACDAKLEPATQDLDEDEDEDAGFWDTTTDR
ncbi:hypothetical protein AAFC00_002568 [Neodothiora populina]|uniref:Pentatricopeptide repeat protein n=1 Tax=Neodothiora populina TaxID=2781224 RepID=A0ABR3P7Y4_9PEZI